MPTHAEKRFLPFAPDQVFDLVLDIERYPQFLPWCKACRIRNREPQHLVADMAIGFKAFRETFSTYVDSRPAWVRKSSGCLGT